MNDEGYRGPFPTVRRRGIGYTSPVAMSARGYNYARVRNTLQIPFDDSIDASNPLECFFQMPTNVNAIRQAKVWVQRKAFREYVSAASSAAGGGTTVTSTTDAQGASPSTSGGDLGIALSHDTLGGHAHASHAHDFNHAATFDDGYATHDHSATVPADAGGTSHTHSGHSDHQHDTLGAHAHATHGAYAHSHTIGHGHSHAHGVTLTDHSHAITLTPGIFETAASGTVSLFVANDGTTYGAAIVSGASSIAAQTLLPQLTTTTGDKRIKIVATGLMRVQVLLLLDLVLIPLGPGQV